MKASELIDKLNEIMKQHGDVEVVSHKFYSAGYHRGVFVGMLPPETVKRYSHYQWDETKMYCVVGADD